MAVAVEIALRVVRPVRDLGDASAHHILGPLVQLFDRIEQSPASEPCEQPAHVLGRLARRSEHGVEVSPALTGDAHVVEEQRKPGVVHATAVADSGRHDAQPFLVDLLHPPGRGFPASCPPRLPSGRGWR